MKVTRIYVCLSTRSVRKVSSHFEYFKNWLNGLDVTWQSVGSETPLTELLVYCVTVAFTMTELANQLHHDNTPAHSTALMQALLVKHHITQVCYPPLRPRFGSLLPLAFA